MGALRNLLYILQLEEYDLDRFHTWVKEHKVWEGLEKKKKLAWTLKAKLLFVTAFIFDSLTFFRRPDKALTFASYVIKPFEFLAKTLLVNLAKLKISRMKNLKVVGITGSFGKTSTKIILKHLLSEKFKVFATPLSYNTPLGIAKVILRGLKPEDEIFIVEMGAYKKGDIRKLCEIVRPQIGILTGINEQHLERFGCLENTIAAKYELIENLPKDGLAVFNYDNPYTRQLAKTTKIPKICYSLDPKTDVEIKAADIRTDFNGTKFLLQRSNISVAAGPWPAQAKRLAGGEQLQTQRMEVQTPLLGRSQVSNILAAVAVATYFKIPLTIYHLPLTTLPPIPHRLQLIDPGTGILILDDTFSANPDGFKEALEVLKSFKSQRKIIVTPGIVELGKKELEVHQELGKKMGTICDFIILVGESPRTDALRRGILETDFSRVNLKTVQDLQEAQDLLKEISRPMDVILFENDLPDQYI